MLATRSKGRATKSIQACQGDPMTEPPSDARRGSAFQLLTLVEGLLFVGLIVTFSVGASAVGLALLVALVVLLVPTVVTYRRIQAWKSGSA